MFLQEVEMERHAHTLRITGSTFEHVICITLVGGRGRQDGGVEFFDFCNTLVNLVNTAADVFNLTDAHTRRHQRVEMHFVL